MAGKNSFYILTILILSFMFFAGCGSDSTKPVKIHIPIKKRRINNNLKSLKTGNIDKSKKYKFKFTLNTFNRDPFKPFFENLEEATPVEDNMTEHIVLTPLTKYKLAQFKLAAIIKGRRKKPIAMVETEDNIGLFFQVGDYIGKELYKVVAIKSDRIILEKKEKDFFNRIKIKRKEIILSAEGE